MIDVRYHYEIFFNCHATAFGLKVKTACLQQEETVMGIKIYHIVRGVMRT